jgi:hypothetical protein
MVSRSRAGRPGTERGKARVSPVRQDASLAMAGPPGEAPMSDIHDRERWRRWLAPPVLAAIVALLSAPITSAAYPATVAVNDTAFDPGCLGFEDSFPEKMYAAAKAAYDRLGYLETGFTGKAFTKSQVLSRASTDWGVYVHSHGDRYLNPDGSRYSGFRSDAGLCTGAPIVYSKDIAARRLGRQSNLVVMSTCELGNADTTMPAAFAIEKDRALALEWNGPEFYLGYVGEAWDSDEWTFEARFWDALASGRGVGAAFDVALAAGRWVHPFKATWWGSYYWSGRAGPGSTCTNCQ